jgi:hypothetical protein
VTDAAATPTPTQKRFVAALLVLLCVPGLGGFELWPLTGWKLFSATRDATQTRWVLEAIDADGATTVVDPDDLPYGYRNAEWPMSRLPGASDRTRTEVCEALLDVTVELRPTTVAVRVVRDRQELVEAADGTYELVRHPEEITTCRP